MRSERGSGDSISTYLMPTTDVPLKRCSDAEISRAESPWPERQRTPAPQLQVPFVLQHGNRSRTRPGHQGTPIVQVTVAPLLSTSLPTLREWQLLFHYKRRVPDVKSDHCHISSNSLKDSPMTTQMTDFDDEKAQYKMDEKVAEADVVPLGGTATNDVWGDLEDGGPNYRALGWVRASVLLMKIQIGLGVLAIVSVVLLTTTDRQPSVLHTLGFAPGILVIVATAVIITCEASLLRI